MPNFLFSKKFHSLIGWSISLILLLWVGSEIDWTVLGREILHLNYYYLLPMTAVMWLHYWVKALRWRYFLPGKCQANNMVLFDALMLGNMVSFILPLRAGEFIRPYILTRETKYNFGTTFSSIIIERFFDLATVLVLMAIISPMIPTLPTWAMNGAISLAVLGTCILLFIVVATYSSSPLIKIIDYCLVILPLKFKAKIRGFLMSLIEAAGVLRGEGRLLQVILYSILSWFLVALIFQLGLMMFGGSWSILVGLTLTVIVALAVAAPSAPGFIGIIQTACVATLTLFGQTKEMALAYSLVVHVHQFIFICTVGLIILSKKQLSLKQIQSQSNKRVAN
ncbi:MAG: lysylphosphatidylglycerol synthase transmembrane domain-containing protein [bacterium]|nr:lysylphosphatidylglycerol synthase transmembrane domain-containing protein [bacterium]